MPPQKPIKPAFPSKYDYIDRKSTSIIEWGTNGGWDKISYDEISLIDAKEGKSYGVLGTRNNKKDADGNDVIGGGAMLGVTANWPSRNPANPDDCVPKFLLVTVAPNTKDGTSTAGKIFKGFAKASLNGSPSQP